MPLTHPLRRRTFVMLIIIAVFLVPLIAHAAFYALGDDPRSWRDADWSTTSLLPTACDFQPARVVVFTGTTGAWKGIFSVHSWIVFKGANAKTWTRYDVVGWGNPLRTNGWPADGRWYGNMPVAIADVSGMDAERLIPKIEQAVHDYRFAHTGDYRIWPGPNSNSFVAAVLRAVPELGVALPPNAVGRDFRDGRIDHHVSVRCLDQVDIASCPQHGNRVVDLDWLIFFLAKRPRSQARDKHDRQHPNDSLHPSPPSADQ